MTTIGDRLEPLNDAPSNSDPAKHTGPPASKLACDSTDHLRRGGRADLPRRHPGSLETRHGCSRVSSCKDVIGDLRCSVPEMWRVDVSSIEFGAWMRYLFDGAGQSRATSLGRLLLRPPFTRRPGETRGTSDSQARWINVYEKGAASRRSSPGIARQS